MLICLFYNIYDGCFRVVVGLSNHLGWSLGTNIWNEVLSIYRKNIIKGVSIQISHDCENYKYQNSD